MAVNFLPISSMGSIPRAIPGINPNPCPDQFRGEYNKGIFKPAAPLNRLGVDYNSSPGQTTYIGNIPIVNPVIAVVLESPHKDEYNAGVPLGPARGTTGRLFDSKFQNIFSQSVLNRHYLSTTYDVILINGVQFQCSLGLPLSNSNNKLNRDANWLNIFNNHGGSADIVDRLQSLNPALIINLCTKGYSNLQMILDRRLRFALSYPYTYGTHPSTWNFLYAKIF